MNKIVLILLVFITSHSVAQEVILPSKVLKYLLERKVLVDSLYSVVEIKDSIINKQDLELKADSILIERYKLDSILLQQVSLKKDTLLFNKDQEIEIVEQKLEKVTFWAIIIISIETLLILLL